MKLMDYHKDTYQNREQLEQVKEAVCTSCTKAFKVKEIKEWLDDSKTACCPHCGVDAVLPKTEGITKEFVKELNQLWFGELLPIGVFEQSEQENQ